jgi:hypothetical protein
MRCTKFERMRSTEFERMRSTEFERMRTLHVSLENKNTKEVWIFNHNNHAFLHGTLVP